MSKRAKLFEAIRNNPKGVRFEDLVRLIEALGFAKARQQGSHAIYQHPQHPAELVTLQPTKDGMAKPYQVKQVLEVSDRCKLEVE